MFIPSPAERSKCSLWTTRSPPPSDCVAPAGRGGVAGAGLRRTYRHEDRSRRATAHIAMPFRVFNGVVASILLPMATLVEAEDESVRKI